jgi:hypothetical protein
MPKQPKVAPVPETKALGNESEPTPELKPSHKTFWGLRKPQSKLEWAVSIFGGLVILALLVLAVPSSRYGILGHFFKRQAAIRVIDSRTHKPVSDVEITIGSKHFKTDANGEAKLGQVPVGGWQVAASKKYYNLETTSIMVPLFGPVKEFQLGLVAIGNQVTVKVTNKITGKPLTKATISALGTVATTDSNGEAVLVLPVEKDKVTGTVKIDGYNQTSVTVTNADGQNSANTFALVPAGKVYYLDKRTGVIDVMKSDLDGSNPTVVLAGTGKEDDNNTVLLASRDWKYLALQAKRDSVNPKLYLINTSNDRLSTIDEGNANFTPAGWLDHNFAYKVDRPDIPYWQSRHFAIKVYSAEKDSVKTADENLSEGTSGYDSVYESFSDLYLLKGAIVYTKSWVGSGGSPQRYQGKQNEIIAVDPTGNNGHNMKVFSSNSAFSISSRPYEAQGVIFEVQNSDNIPLQFFEMDDGGVRTADKDITSDTFVQAYPTYLQSPSGVKTFWSEQRDGKNTLFEGDEKGDARKEVASLSDFTPYGWYSDDYVLISKNKSELYISPVDFSSAPVKITDYHKPAVTFNGYGGGYGGQ